MQEGIEGVIFDMDGTLIDSEPLWHIAEKEVFEPLLGYRISDEQCEETTGRAASTPSFVSSSVSRHTNTCTHDAYALRALCARMYTPMAMHGHTPGDCCRDKLETRLGYMQIWYSCRRITMGSDGMSRMYPGA